MVTQIFLNLPVADVAAAAAFYAAIGLKKNAAFSSEHAASFRWTDGVVLQLLDKTIYAVLTPKRIVDPRAESQILIAIELDSRSAVDAMTKAAVAAGGREAHGPEDDGTVYSRAFEDLDGHGFGPFCTITAAG